MLASLLGALLLYGVLWRDGPLQSGDTSSYLEVARDLTDLRLDRLHLRTPGYPLLLLASGGAVEPGAVLVWIQLALVLTAAWTLARLLDDLGASTVAQWTFVGIASMPHLVQVADCAESEALAQALLSLAFVALVRGCLVEERLWWVGAVSLLLGLAAITRPAFEVTAPSLAVAIAIAALCSPSRERRRHLVQAALVLPLGTLLLAGGLGLWQRSRFGAAGSPLLAFSLAVKTAPYVESLPEDFGPVREILLRHRDRQMLRERHHLPEGHIFTAWPELVAQFDGDEVAAARAVMTANLEIIQREPRVFLVQSWRASFRYWEWYLQPVPGFGVWPIKGVLFVIQMATTLAYWTLLASGCVAALVLWPARGRPRDAARPWLPDPAVASALTLGAVIVLSAVGAQSVLGVGHARYHLPTDQIVLASVCLGGDALARLRAQVTRRAGG